jgi:hypothetical protein
VWKANFAAPESAAWHSTLSPVLASLDLFDADYSTGQTVTTELNLINDSWHDAEVKVDLLLTRECPEWIPEAECLDRPIRKWSYEFALGADSMEKAPVTWKLPEEEGAYWLAARLTGVPGRPVLSQRFVRAIQPVDVPESLRQRTYVVLGGSDAASAFFDSRGLRTWDQVDQLSPADHTVVIWDAERLTPAEKRNARALCEFADRGGHVLVLAASSWNWPELCRVDIKHGPRFSRVFPHRNLRGALIDSLDPQWLIRWNGLPGTVAVGTLEGSVMERAEKLLWAREAETTVTAWVPAASGQARILFSQLDLQRRVERSSPFYDPAAERILLMMLEQVNEGKAR